MTDRFDVDENDVEGKVKLWTCIKTGIDDDGHDPDSDWQEPKPELFLSRDEAVQCAIDELRGCMEGEYDDEEIRREVKKARWALGDSPDSFYEFRIDDTLTRRWDVWLTPLDTGDGESVSQGE